MCKEANFFSLANLKLALLCFCREESVRRNISLFNLARFGLVWARTARPWDWDLSNAMHEQTARLTGFTLIIIHQNQSHEGVRDSMTAGSKSDLWGHSHGSKEWGNNKQTWPSQHGIHVRTTIREYLCIFAVSFRLKKLEEVELSSWTA